MARFIIANRRAGKFHEDEKKSSRNALNVSFDKNLSKSVDIIGDTSPEDEKARRVIIFNAEPAEVRSKKEMMPDDVIVEPEILHFKTIALPRDISRLPATKALIPIPAGIGSRLDVTIQGEGNPLEGASVILFLRAFGYFTTRIEATTPSSGRLSFEYSYFWSPAALVILPYANYWNYLVRGPKNDMVIDVPALPKTGPLAWWHENMGIKTYEEGRGIGIRVGVLDTGIGPNGALNHINNVGAFIDGTHNATIEAGADVDKHGSHVCGTIGARPVRDGDFAGIAPGVELYSARVFPPNAGAHQGDIALAIDYLSSVHSVDIINMSLGSSEASEIEHDAIIDALERGTLCICAAANDGVEPVDYPARFPETIAVSALGLEGWEPAGSLSSLNYPDDPEKFGRDNLYLASFSNYGPSLDSAGPGVGVISTVPERVSLKAPYAAMDGTSMATPAVCGAIASILSTSDIYGTLPRDITRAEAARNLLRIHAQDIGLKNIYQGHGLPQV